MLPTAPLSIWRIAKLGEIVHMGSRNVDPNELPNSFWNYVGLENIEPGTGQLSGFSPTVGSKIGSTKASFRKGDVLYGKLRPYLRKAWVAEFDGCSSTDLIPLTPGPQIDAQYLKWFLLSPLHMEYITPLMAGIRMPRLRSEAIHNMPVPLPPLDEQRRIVARIEELMERSRRVRGVLETVLRDCKVLESSLLLDGITDSNHLKVSENCLSTGEASLLPDGWSFRRLDDLVIYGPRNGYSPRSSPGASGARTLKLSATTTGRLILNSNTTKRIDEMIDSDSGLWLSPGDLLIQRANTLDYVGTAVVYDGPGHAYIYPDLMMCVRFAQPVPGEWVACLLNSPFGRAWVRSVATGTAGNMPKINGANLRRMWVPIPPTGVMARLVKRMSDGRTRCDAVRRLVEEQMMSLEAMERSILGGIFTGTI